VIVVSKFKTEKEAIELANDTSYGLGAGLHSSGFMFFRTFVSVSSLMILSEDADQCMRVSTALEAGTVCIQIA
jgi:aldehyde dehydrogenase (NAD+)